VLAREATELDHYFVRTDDRDRQKVSAPTGISNPAVIDLFAVDPKTDEIVLVMRESREWNGSDEQLHQIQEKFNAYASFLLDGELAAAHPELIGKRARIELRCDHTPDEHALSLLSLIHDQLAFQEIKMEVIVSRKRESSEPAAGQN